MMLNMKNIVLIVLAMSTSFLLSYVHFSSIASAVPECLPADMELTGDWLEYLYGQAEDNGGQLEIPICNSKADQALLDDLEPHTIASSTDCGDRGKAQTPNKAAATLSLGSFCDLDADGIWDLDELSIGAVYEVYVQGDEYIVTCSSGWCNVSCEDRDRYAIRRMQEEGWENTGNELRIGVCGTDNRVLLYGARHWKPIVSIDPDSKDTPEIRVLLAFWKTRHDLPGPKFDCIVDMIVFASRLDDPGYVFSERLVELPYSGTLIHALPSDLWIGHGDGVYGILGSSVCEKSYYSVGVVHSEFFNAQPIIVGDGMQYFPHRTYAPSVTT